MIVVLGAWHIIAAFAVVSTIYWLHRIAPELGTGSRGAPPKVCAALCDGASTVVRLEPAASRALIAMLVLWFTVLSPSNLLTAYLTSQGVPGPDVARFRSILQLVGLIGTVIAPP